MQRDLRRNPYRKAPACVVLTVPTRQIVCASSAGMISALVGFPPPCPLHPRRINCITTFDCLSGSRDATHRGKKKKKIQGNERTLRRTRREKPRRPFSQGRICSTGRFKEDRWTASGISRGAFEVGGLGEAKERFCSVHPAVPQCRAKPITRPN